MVKLHERASSLILDLQKRATAAFNDGALELDELNKFAKALETISEICEKARKRYEQKGN